MSPRGFPFVAGSLALALSACAGNGMGLDANGNPITAGGGSTGPLTADFKSIQDNVFTPICTKCHIGAGAPEGLQLDQTHSYAMLVGVPSAEQPNVLRVAAGDPDSSYIVLKLQGSAGISGARMPFGGPYLPQSTIDVIRQWISAGAANSTSATNAATAKAAQRFTVTASSPDPDSIATTVPNIVVAFSSDVDPNLLNATMVSLEKLDASNMDSTEPMPMSPMPMSPVPAGAASRSVAITLAVPHGDGTALLITPRTLLSSGTY